MYNCARLFVLLLAISGISPLSEAGEYDGAFSLVVENDVLTGSDSNYTTGLMPAPPKAGIHNFLTSQFSMLAIRPGTFGVTEVLETQEPGESFRWLMLRSATMQQRLALVRSLKQDEAYPRRLA